MIQVVSYNFSIVENPLSDGGNFTTVVDPDFPGVLKTVAGNFCEPASLGNPALSFYSGPVPSPGNTWPADQYSELTLTTATPAQEPNFFIAVRQGAATSGTQYLISILLNSQRLDVNAVVAGSVHTLFTGPQTWAQGDVVRFAVQGNVLSILRNGTVAQTITDTNNYITSGSPGFGLFVASSLSANQTSLWAGGASQAATPTFSPNGGTFTSTQTVTIASTSGGTIYYTTDGSTPTQASSSIASGGTISVSTTQTVKAIASAANNVDSLVGSASFTINASSHYSVPDCRDYATFPNNSRDVQGTLTYDVNAHPSHPAPVDSRAAGAPVDSRTTANIPLNSRVQP